MKMDRFEEATYPKSEQNKRFHMVSHTYNSVPNHVASDTPRQLVQDRIEKGTLTVSLISGVVRSLSSALAKTVTSERAVHISLFDPIAKTEHTTPSHQNNGKLGNLYQSILDRAKQLEDTANLNRINLREHPINALVKFQSYHIDAEQIADICSLTRGRAIFCIREPARTMESSIVVALNIIQNRHPNIAIANILVPEADQSFMLNVNGRTPIQKLVYHLLKNRDFSILGEGFAAYLCDYPAFDDSELKKNIWEKYAKLNGTEAEVEAIKLGFTDFAQLIDRY